jgi:DNA-binding response OmpR family regulator
VANTSRLLLVEPDAPSACLLVKHLQAQGYSVKTVPDTLSAWDYVSTSSSHLVLIGETLPDEDSLAFCHKLRSSGFLTPILRLSLACHFSSRVSILDAGADDALSHPFAIDELHARIRALLRRSRMEVGQGDAADLVHRDLVVNTRMRRVWRDGTLVKLTVKEYDLLIALLRSCNQVVPRKQLLLDVWGDSWVGSDNLLDVYIRYLRNKLDRPGLEPLIHTVRGVGFLLM